MNRNLDQINTFLLNLEESVKNQIEEIDLDKIEKVSQLLIIKRSKRYRFHFSGIGKSSQVALYMSSLYSSIGFPSYYLDATEAIHGSLGQVKPGDVVFLISNSGETHELIKTAKYLKTNGAYLIAVNRSPKSELSLLSDEYLIAYAKKEGDNLNKPPRASVVCQIIVLQTLSIMIQTDSNLKIETYLKWHPGGKIGESKDSM